MKYLLTQKLFESIKSTEIKEFIDSHLSYLYDEFPFEITVTERGGEYKFYYFTIKFNDKINFLDIKDYFIPFIYSLENKYKLFYFERNTNANGNIYLDTTIFTTSELESIGRIYYLSEISFFIKIN